MTRNRAQLFAIVGAVLMIASLLAPAAAGAAVAEEEPGDLTIDVEDNVVTIADDDGPVDNATVIVEQVDDDADQEDSEEEDAEDDDADESDEESYEYDGTGEYETDEDGQVELPAPEQEVDVTVTAEDGDQTAETTATLTPDDPATNFGQEVSSFVADLQDQNTSGPMGLHVAEFVTENNPAADKIPDHAGPPEHAGPGGDDDGEQGPPAHAGPGDDDDSEQGPPADAGPGGDDTEDEETEDDEADDEDADSDDETDDDADA